MDSVRQARYFVEAAAKVLDVLESFASAEEFLTITEVARRANLTYSSAFRLLYTLERRGYVMRRPGKKKYTLSPARKRFRIGYAALNATTFHREVSASLLTAAQRLGLTLIVRANQEFNISKALVNADQLIAERVSLLIEYQYSEVASDLIAAKCHGAGIPIIGINFALPGAYYFGGNNYQTGALAGGFLANYANRHWNGRVDTCLVLLPKGLTSTQETRKLGLTEALLKGLPSLRRSEIEIAPKALTIAQGNRLTLERLKRLGASKRILIAALTDHLGLGAEKAIRSAGAADRAVVVGQGGGKDARTRIRTGGPFKASVAFFSESYGESILQLAIRILDGDRAPLTSYTNHVVLTRENLNEYYPDERIHPIRRT